ncbi:MAG: TonB-dependent receptor [Acidobacteriota bacterium]
MTRAMKEYLRLAVLGALLTLVGVTAASAQDTTDPSPEESKKEVGQDGEGKQEKEVVLTEAGGRIVVSDEVSVTDTVGGYQTESTSVATKTFTPLLQIPLNVTVAERDQLDDMQAINISKSHDYAAGFMAVGYSGLAMARGFSVSWYDHRRDGLRIFSWSIREPVSLEKIQYLRGPAGVLYGDGSPGGLVNLVQKKPLPVSQYELGIEGGNLGYRRAIGDATGSLSQNGKLLYRVVGAWEQIDNDNNNDEQRYSILPSFSYRIGNRTTLTVDGEYYDEQGRGSGQNFPVHPDLIAGNFDALPFDVNFANPDDRWSNWNSSVGARADAVLGSNGSLHSALRYTKIIGENDYHAPFGGFLPDNRNLIRFFIQGATDWREYQSDTFGTLNIEGDKTIHRLVGGFEIGRSTTNGDNGFGPAGILDIFNPVYGERPESTPFSVQSNFETRRVGVYAQDQFSIGDKWHFMGSVRWSEVENNNRIAQDVNTEDDVTPRVGVVYQPSSNYSVYASYTNGFEPAGAGIFLEDGSPADPTNSDSYEIGFKANFLNSRLTLNSALYQIERTNIPQFVQETNAYVQIGGAESEGFEIDLVGRLTRALQIRAGLALNETEITDDVRGFEGFDLINTPDENVSLWLNYTLPSGALQGLSFKGGAVYVSERFADDGNTLVIPDYTRYDLGVDYETARNMVIDLSVENLTDERFFQSGFATAWTFANSRRVSLSVRQRF